MNKDIQHHGILGQRWGVRRFQNKDGSLTPVGKRRLENGEQGTAQNKGKKSSNSTSSKKIKEMSDSELREKISRLELEKKYSDLMKMENTPKVNKGKAFVMDVLEKSGKNIAIQTATYFMGTMVNKMVGDDIVNPKKGQKDK